jgi:uncharacterized coiled-coil protein SlyX
MSKQHFSVVRNAAYSAASIGVRERHNERKNETYYNADIVPERAPLNAHFKSCAGTYQQEFDRMIEDGVIVKRGLKTDAKVFDELVFDVNTSYFEENGGYDFARKFYQSAYELAVKEIGGEQFILSAVLHADERNSALSKELGRDVYHYHLHVVYVPVVPKEVRWTKRRKDPALVGTVKEVIPQISHSKKWPKEKVADDKWINSYSLLQDRYFEHMRAAGFDGFERGKPGSTKEHLTVMEYKVQQERERLDELYQQIEKQEAKIEKLDAKLDVKKTKAATLAEINAMGHSLPVVPGVHFSDDETKRLKSLARKSVTLDDRITAQKKKMAALDEQISDLNSKLRDAKAEITHWHREYTDLWNEVKDFIQAIRKFPARLREFIVTLFPKREQEQVYQQAQTQKSKSRGYDR